MEKEEMTKRAMVIRIVAMVCVVAVVVTLMILSFLGGRTIDISDGLLALGGFLGGLLAAFGLRNKSLGAGLVALLMVGSMACSMQPYQIARATLDSTRSVVTALEGEIPLEHEHADEAFDITRSALAIGEVAVSLWEERGSSDAPLGWSKWVQAALNGLSIIVDIFKEIGIDVPPYVQVALTALSGLMPALGGGSS